MPTQQGIRIFLKEDVQAILNHFSSLFDIRIAFFLPDGTTVQSGIQKQNSGFCRFLRHRLKLQDHCLRNDQARRLECARKRKMVAYTCHAGLRECVAPVYVLDELIAFVMIGQFRCTRKPDSRVLNRCPDARARQALAREFARLTYVPSHKAASLFFIFKILVDFIVAAHLVEVKKGLTVQKVIDYIETHVHEKVRLSDVAHFCCKSNTSITHLFKKEQGMSFKSYLIQRKLEKAREYLAQYPDMTVDEVAEKLGFSDQFHFSKTFKSRLGGSPSKVRSRRLPS